MGSCIISQVGDHFGVCATSRAVKGDKVLAINTATDATEAAKHVTVQQISEKERSRRMALLISAVVPKVAYSGEDDVEAIRVPARGRIGIEAWAARSGSTGNYQRETVGIYIQERSLGFRGLTGTVDFSTWIWSKQPSGARFRPDKTFQFYFPEASISYRRHRTPLQLTLGRIRPANLPGLTMLDGSEVGWRFDEYGGSVPKISSLGATADQWLLGLYYDQLYPTGDKIYVRHQMRLGLNRTLDFGKRSDFEMRLISALGQTFDVGLELKMGLGGGTLSGFTFDALRADFGMSPTEKVRVQLGGRLLKRQTVEIAQVIKSGSRDMDGRVLLDAAPWVTVGMQGGAAFERLGDELHRYYAGPELRFPRALGLRNALSAGYQEEFGWSRGRMLYVQPISQLSDRVRLVSRASFSQESTFERRNYDWGIYSSLEAYLFSMLSLRMSLQVRDGSGPFGVVGGIDLTGSI
jgi:hypothetical protein